MLVKACLNNLPVYLFQLHRIPSGILSILDKKRRKFFWGELSDKNAPSQRKLHLINWKKSANLNKKVDYALIIFSQGIWHCYLNGGGNGLQIEQDYGGVSFSKNTTFPLGKD